MLMFEDTSINNRMTGSIHPHILGETFPPWQSTFKMKNEKGRPEFVRDYRVVQFSDKRVLTVTYGDTNDLVRSASFDDPQIVGHTGYGKAIIMSRDGRGNLKEGVLEQNLILIHNCRTEHIEKARLADRAT